MPDMDLRLVFGTVIILALMLAIVAGFAAARVLMRATESSSGHGRDPLDR